MITNQYKKAH